MRSLTAIIALILILAGVNWSIMHKEQQLESGTVAYLKLRPRDPRSLMQGDYMALRFQMAAVIHDVLPKSKNKRWRHNIDASDGYVVVSLDEKRVATYKAIYTKDTVLADNELKMRYRVRGRTVKFATNAFFFQEGTAKVYEDAKYGQFRVAHNGELLLASMHDENLVKLEPKSIK